MTGSSSLVLIHLSDTHFGDVPATPFWDPIKGYRAHDLVLTQALPNALENVALDLECDPDQPLGFVLSGDLTVSGTDRQFAVAGQYLAGQGVLDDVPWGIGAYLREQERVPGNHDHWDGVMPQFPRILPLQRAFNPAIFPRHFRSHPWGPVGLECAEFRLEMFGVDSLSGFRSGETNLRARGRISPCHFHRLTARIRRARKPRRRSSVRVLVLHHPVRTGRFLMELDEDSHRLAVSFCKREGISVVLVGHEHTFDARPPQVVNGLFHPFWELRAPSAFQGMAADSKHGFLTHHIQREAAPGGRLLWTCYPYLWRGDTQRFSCEEGDIVRFGLPEAAI